MVLWFVPWPSSNLFALPFAIAIAGFPIQYRHPNEKQSTGNNERKIRSMLLLASEHPMIHFMTYILIAVAVFAFGAVVERARLRKFWSRACTGRLWKRRFPQASKTEIREFLDLFIDSFAFSQSRRLCFSPDDQVMDVYRALYPYPKFMADSLELETFSLMAEEHYGVDLVPTWRQDITLGEIYEQAHRLA